MLADFASAFTQGNRLFTLQIGDGRTLGDRLLPQSVEGTEELSGCYKYEVTCLSPDAFIPLNSLLGQAAQLDIIAGNGGMLHGFASGPPEEITRCGLITAARALPSDGGFAKYLFTIEPPMALLRNRRTSRVFQDKTVLKIVEQILTEHINANSAIGGAFKQKYDLYTEHRYTPRSYCLQYRETDLAFIERLLFEEGLSYRFEHEGGDTPTVTFIVFDDPFGLPQCSQKSVRFHRAEATESEDSLTEWMASRRTGPSSASLTSFDYKPVTTSDTVSNGQAGASEQDEEMGIPCEASLEDFDAQALYYATDGNDLHRYAGLRQDVHDRQKGGYLAQGNLRGLMAGEWFELMNHPSFEKQLSEEREFVACKVAFTAHNNLPQNLSRRLTSFLPPFGAPPPPPPPPPAAPPPPPPPPPGPPPPIRFFLPP